MSKVYEVGFKLSAKMASSFSSSFVRAQQSVGGLSDRLTDLNRQSAKVDALVKGKRAVAESSRAYVQARQKVAELGRAMSATEKPSRDMVRDFNNAKRALDKVKTSLDKNRLALRQLEASSGMAGQKLSTLTSRQQALAKATDSARRALERQAKIQNKIDATSGAQERMSAMRGSAASSLVAVGATAGAVGAVPVSQALSMEDQQAELRKFSDEHEKVFAGIKQLSLTYANSTEDMTAMAANAFQSGIAKTGEEALKLVEIQNQMAIAFDMTGEEVGSAYADIQSKMGLTIDQSKELFDVVNAIGNTTSASSKDVVEVLARAGGAVRGLTAMTGNQTAALAGAFRSAAVSSETASTSMMTFINAMSAGEGATKSQRDGLAALGVDAVKVSKMMVAGPEHAQRAIQDVLARINKLNDADKSAIIGKIFGNEAGVKSAVATLAKQTHLLGGNFELIGDRAKYVGSMLAEYKARADTTSNSLAVAKNASMLFAAGIGDTLLPTIKEASESFTDATKVAVEWMSENKELVANAVKVTGAIFGAVAAFHAVRLAVAVVAGPILAVRKAVLMTQSAMIALRSSMVLQTVATKAWAAASVVAQGVMKGVALATKAFNLVLMGNPIALTVTAIAGLIAAGVALWKNWDVVKAKLGTFFEFWQTAWQSAKQVFADAFNSLTSIAIKPINAVIKMINSVIQAINGLSFTVPDWVPGMGGKKFSANLSQIPTLGGKGAVAEKAEALSQSSKSASAPVASGPVTFSPVINVSGDGKTTKEEISAILSEQFANFRRQMERYEQEKRRLSYE